jgi:hypothetical protein
MENKEKIKADEILGKTITRIFRDEPEYYKGHPIQGLNPSGDSWYYNVFLELDNSSLFQIPGWCPDPEIIKIDHNNIVKNNLVEFTSEYNIHECLGRVIKNIVILYDRLLFVLLSEDMLLWIETDIFGTEIRHEYVKDMTGFDGNMLSKTKSYWPNT